MNNRRRIAELENATCDLPEGYSIEKLGFQKWQLSFNGCPLKTFERESWAKNAAQRHNTGKL